jgi:hypothetical protein
LTGLTETRESLSAGTGLLSNHKLKTGVPNQILKEPVSTQMLATKNSQTQMLTAILRGPVRMRACLPKRGRCAGRQGLHVRERRISVKEMLTL